MKANNNSFKYWLSDPVIQSFVDNNEKGDIKELAFKLSSFPLEKRSFILDQINGRKKALKKFDHLQGISEIIFPANISIEQSSSSITGQYKANMINGKRIVDLTAGFGVDAYFFAQKFEEIDLIESSSHLLEITAHNFKCLGISNARFHHSDAASFLKTIKTKVDAFYLDPSRRDSGKRLLDIREYDPNFIDILDLLEEKADQILIKLSPITDLHQILRLIPNLSSITVLSVKNECKEILVLISRGKKFSGKFQCVDLSNKNEQSYNFNIKSEEESEYRFTQMQTYLYLPMAAIVKAGAFKSISKDYDLGKISGNTHIYTSDESLLDFPGRVFKCLDSISLNRYDLKTKFNTKHFNVICRNFPLKPAELANKLGIQEGGNLYIIAFRDNKEKNQIILAEKLSLNE